MNELIKTLSFVDWNSMLPIITISGWIVSALIGYRLGIRSRTKEIVMRTCEEIRNETWELIDNFKSYWNCCFSQKLYSSNPKTGEKIQINTLYGYMGDTPYEKLSKIQDLINKANDSISVCDKFHVLSNFKKIIKIYTEIKDIVPTTNEFPNDYNKKLLKYVSKIKRFY